MDKLKKNSKVWIQTGILSKQRIIDLSALYDRHGELFCKSLSGFHAFTGCDFNPAFFRKGKQRPLKLLLLSEQFQSAFAELSNEDCDRLTVFRNIEKFVCSLYTMKSLDSVDNARFALFFLNYKVNNVNEPFQKKNLQNFDASSIPPCAAELRPQLLRSMYIARLWSHAHKKIPTNLVPEDCGWVIVDSKYQFQWFDGPQIPSSVKDVIIDQEQPEGTNISTRFRSYIC